VSGGSGVGVTQCGAIQAKKDDGKGYIASCPRVATE